MFMINHTPEYIKYMKDFVPTAAPDTFVDCSGRVVLPLDNVFFDCDTDQEDVMVTLPGHVKTIVDADRIQIEFDQIFQQVLGPLLAMVPREHTMKFAPPGPLFAEMCQTVTVYHANLLLMLRDSTGQPPQVTIRGKNITKLI